MNRASFPFFAISLMIAAEQTQRRAFLMEIDPAYCDVIVQRWESFTGRKGARIEAGETTSGPGTEGSK